MPLWYGITLRDGEIPLFLTSVLILHCFSSIWNRNQSDREKQHLTQVMADDATSVILWHLLFSFYTLLAHSSKFLLEYVQGCDRVRHSHPFIGCWSYPEILRKLKFCVSLSMQCSHSRSLDYFASMVIACVVFLPEQLPNLKRVLVF